MTEDKVNEMSADTAAENTATEKTATTPENNTEITIPVKYNKETRQLDIETAAALAQKGMKYDVISKDYEELKNMAKRENKSVSKFLADIKCGILEQRKNYLTEKCGGDSELAEHILGLENTQNTGDNGFAELKGLFPEIVSEHDLPPEVLENASQKGTLLLDEFLRYRLKNEREQQKALTQQKKAQSTSLGSQLSPKSAENPETEEFLKGLWN